MSNLTLKGIPEHLHERLRDVAEANRRSLNGEVIHRLERSFERGGAAMVVREQGAAAYLAAVTGGGAMPEPLTLAEFIALPEEDLVRMELAGGRLVREPAPGLRHGQVGSRLYPILWEAAGESGQGQVFFDMGFQLSRDPPTVRVPDLAFVSAGRLAEHEPEEVFLAGAPELAVEILSPSNSASEIQRKAFEYLDAGARLVWIADPEARTVTVCRGRDDIRVRGEGEILDGTAVVPGLEVEVGRIFG